MEKELTPEQKFAQDDPDTLVPRELARGKTREEIVTELLRLDWSPVAAQHKVKLIADEFERYTASPESRDRLIAKKKKIRTNGVSCLISGLTLTYYGFTSRSFLQMYGGAMLGAIGLWAIAVQSRQLDRYAKYSILIDRP